MRSGWIINTVRAVCAVAICALAACLVALPGCESVPQAQDSAQRGFVPDAAMDRSKIPDVYKWNLDPLFAGAEAWEEGIGRIQRGQKKLASFEGRLAEPEVLLGCLKTYFDLHVLANRVTLYANLKNTENVVDAAGQARLDRGLQVMDGLMEAARFIRSEVMGLDDGVLAAAYAQAPGLSEYKPYIEDFRRRRAILLSGEGERILALAGDNLFAEIDLNEIPSHAEKAFIGLMSDVVFPEIEDADGKMVRLTNSNYGKYRGSADREIRRRAVEAFFATLKQNRHALAAAFAGQVAFNSFLARARGYGSAREAYLDKDDIDLAVYDNLVDTINANLKPLHRYMALRKRIMGVAELRLHDLYVPMVAGVERTVPFEEARSVILAALEPLGAEYLGAIGEGLDPASGWIDLYPCANKESSAFSASTYGIRPYVKMNYFETLNDAFTLAHEYGHAIHSHLSMANQPPASFHYVSFIAEVASTFNEMLMSRYLIARTTDRKEKLHLLNERAEKIRTTIYRQTLFAEFEKTVHELYESGVSLTADVLNETYIGLIRRYYGDAFTVGPDDDVEWAYIPHFYWKFYVFTYATGLSAGISLAQGVAEGDDGARDRYLAMLKGGCSLPPIELLRRGGADLTRPDAIEAAVRLLDRTLDEMEELLEEG